MTRVLMGVVLLAGCGARSGLLEGSDPPSGDGPRPRGDAPLVADTFSTPDARRSCTTDADCATGNPCIGSTCSPAGTCVDRPLPMGQVKELSFSGLLGMGAGAGSLAHGLVRTQNTLSAQPFSLDGPAGGDTLLGTVDGTRPWDSAIAAVPGGLAMVTSVKGGLELRLSSKPGAMDRLESSGIFVRLAPSGSRLVATSDLGHNCGVAWADATTGKWTTKSSSMPGGCTGASLPHPKGGMTGLPPYIYPAGFSQGGAAILLSVASDGKVTRLTAASDGSLKKDGLSLASAGSGPKYFHSLVAAQGGGGVGALWCRTESADSKTTQVNMALLDGGSLEPLGPVSTQTVKGQFRPYAFYMDMLFCEGRYVGIWYDGSGGAAWQLGPDGQPLGPVLRFGHALDIARIDAVCVKGGVVVFAASGAVTLRCPGV